MLRPPVTVVVPVLNRPQNAGPFMSSLRRTAPGANVIALVNAHDDIETAQEWVRYGAAVWPHWSPPGSFAQKANTALPYVHTEWFFLTGDDVKFEMGWLEEALAVAQDSGAMVIGTNDAARPEVEAGLTAVHFLINTAYARDVGCGWDGPGVVAHEGYRHWFVDNEIVAASAQRGVWASAPRSVVAHMHPYFGRGEMDDTYRLGESGATQDHETWERRLHHSAPELVPAEEAPSAT